MIRADQAGRHLQDREGEVQRRRRGHRRAARQRASRCWSARSRWRTPRSCRSCCAAGASRTRCSTRSSTPRRPRSSPRPAARARSRSRPTWPAVAPTSCSAATPSSSPRPSCASAASTRRSTPEEYAKALEEVLPALEEAVRRPRPRRSSTAGGLYVLGTERHESRRIDNQLRGRSGRQGDPGESRFYLSLQDELMRRFRAGAVEAVMERLQHPRGRADRVEDGHPADQERADPDRGPERRDPQERPQVRRGA